MNFKDFALEHGLNIWDWIAFIVSFSSMLIAVVSMFVAVFTLKSQRQTEKNTMPIINKDIQEFLLQEFIIKLLDGQIRIGALWYSLYEKEFDYYPSEQILEKLKVETDTIHTELFYNDNTQYRCIQGLFNMTKEYNVNISVLNSHLSNISINNDLLYQEFNNILMQNEQIAETWKKVMTCLYNYNNTHTAIIFSRIMDTTEEPPTDYNLICFKENNEKYLDLMDNDDKKIKLLYYMDSRATRLIKEYDNFLIKK